MIAYELKCLDCELSWLVLSAEVVEKVCIECKKRRIVFESITEENQITAMVMTLERQVSDLSERVKEVEATLDPVEVDETYFDS